MADRLVVFCWHNIDATWHAPAAPGAGARGFARQLALLARLGRPVPLAPALRDLADGRPLPPRAFALTFDDGYLDNLLVAAPLLRRHGLPATFFLVPGLLSRTVRPWWEVTGRAFQEAAAPVARWRGRELPTKGRAGRQAMGQVVGELKLLDRAGREAAVDELVDALAPRAGGDDWARLFMDWDQAAQLAGLGFEIGNHSSWHAIMSREPAEAQAADLAGARRELQDRLGTDAEVLAYPNGRWADFDEATMDAAKQAGHRHAVTTQLGVNRPDTRPLALRRVVLEPDRGLAANALTKLTGRLRHAAAPA
jgi:peptidoglycan/xylan/chitin deacetylase (PgdA/CDA1 family)